MTSLPATESCVEKVRALESVLMKMPQKELKTDHVFHAGTYLRTIVLPPETVITGVQIKIPTVVILSGDCLVFGENGPVRFTGYHVLCGQKGRKQAFYALEETSITMLFATYAQTIEEAEHEFTDEYDLLGSHREQK